jgi:amidase
MTIQRPTRAELRELAEQANIPLTEAELDDYRQLVDGVLAQLEQVQALPKPTSEAEPEHGERTGGYRPNADEDTLNVWIRKCEVAGAESGPLAERTVGLKDNVCLAGVELTCGSHMLEGYVPDVDATVVRRLLAAGATIAGKTNMESFSFSSLSTISDFGPVQNPAAPRYIAGGSSSGSAAAVAAGETDLAIGTDQGGSVRMPASICGVVGIKPTYGLVPFTGIFPIENTVDHVGPIAGTVQEVAEALDVLAGRDELDARQPADLEPESYAAGLKSEAVDLDIVVLTEGFEQDTADEAVSAVAREAVADLNDQGASTIEVSVPPHRHGPELWTAIGGYGGHRVLQQGGVVTGSDGWYNTGLMQVFDKFARSGAGRDYPPTVKTTILAQSYLQRQYRPKLYGKAQNLVRQLRQRYDEILNDADVIAMPTVPVAPFEIDDEQSRIDRIVDSGLDPLGANTCPFNMTHHPAVTVPCGEADGLPVGLMLVGDHFDDATVLRAAASVEATTE